MDLFRIYCDDGSVFEGDKSSEIPNTQRYGIIAVVQPNERTGREILSGKDWYLFRSDIGRWFACDQAGMEDQQITYTDHITCMLKGRLMERKAYEDIINRAIDDVGLPPMFVKRA